MSRQTLKDKSGNSIGSIETDSSGKMTGKDKSGNYVGVFDPKANITKDRSGNLVGSGNLLAILITKG